MPELVGRPVQVSWAHLGAKGKPYDVTVQTSLYEFDDNVEGPKGTMYITLNRRLAGPEWDNHVDRKWVVGKIIEAWKGR